MNWILFGFKGCGKTYFGRRLGLPFLDTDDLIEQRENANIRKIVKEKGEGYFRALEKQIVASLNVQNHVVAVGGGTVLDDENLEFLQKLGHLIYLNCPKSILKKRILKPPLPTYLDPRDPDGSFEKMYCTRIVKYEKIPAYRVDLNEKTDGEILGELWQIINLETSFASPRGANPTAKPSA